MSNFDPYTGAPLRRTKASTGCLRAAMIGMAIFLGVAVILWKMGTPDSGSPATASGSSTSTSMAAHQAPASGFPVVTHRGVAVGLSNVDVTDKVGLEYMEQPAADGGVLVVVHYQIRNGSDRPIEAYHLPKLHLVDPSGVSFNEDAGKTGAAELADKDDVKAFSDLNPGITVVGVAVFEVSKAAFNSATWSVRAGDYGPLVPVSKIPS